MNKYFLISFILAFTFLTLPFKSLATVSTTNNLISGFAKWQASRVEKITIEIFFDELTDDEKVKRFFPLTAKSIKYYDPYSSFSLANVISTSIAADMQNIDYLVHECVPKYVENQFSDGVNDAIAAKNLLKLKEYLDQFLNYNLQIGPSLDDIKNDICKDENGEFIKFASDEDYLKVLKGKESQIVAIVNRLLTNNSLITINYNIQGNSTPSNINNTQTPKVKINHILAGIKMLVDSAETIKFVKREMDDKRFVVAANTLVNLFQTFTPVEQTKFIEFTHIKKQVINMAKLAEAANKDANSVASVLDSIVDEESAYTAKRAYNTLLYSSFQSRKIHSDGEVRPTTYSQLFTSSSNNFRDTFILASYFGVAHDGDDFRPFGPVGLDFKLARWETGTLTLGYFPLDFGSPIYFELTDTEHDTEWEDIKSNIIMLSYSFHKKPIALNFGYMRNDLDLNTNLLDESKVFISLTYDLPILNLTFW